ncbi:unnamed protein product, partial [Adineta steineri]
MNAVYKPLDISALNNGRLIIFWTNSEDEVTTKRRPGNGGVWSPNHFVPLIRPCETPESPRKTTIKNNKVASIRSPEFSPPPNTRKHKTSVSLTEESLSNLEINDTRRKRQERIIANEQQRKERLAADRLRKRNARENESEEQRQRRRATDRLSKRTAREKESEDQEQLRLVTDRLSKRTARENETNKMWIGDVPLELQQLTIAEEKLISLYRHSSCVIKLQSPFHHHSTAQAALKGNVITFMHNMPNIVTSLPLDVEDLSDTLKIVFIGAHSPDRVQLRKICGVRRQKIRNALIWLKNHNDMYRMIPINEVNIAKLPDDDVPESIWTTLERIENANDGNAERAGFTVDPLTHATAQGESNVTNICPMSTSAVLDVNGTTISSEDIGVHLLHKVSNNLSNLPSDSLEKSAEDEDNVYMIPRSHMPINDCFNPELLLGLYPTLFPYGCGAPQDSSRPVSVSLEQHIRYLLAYDDQRFEKHHSFLFVLFNIMQRRQACWNATLMASRPYFQNAASDLQTLTSKEIEAALITINKKTFSSVDNPRINMLMRQIKTVGGNVMGS